MSGGGVGVVTDISTRRALVARDARRDVRTTMDEADERARPHCDLCGDGRRVERREGEGEGGRARRRSRRDGVCQEATRSITNDAREPTRERADERCVGARKDVDARRAKPSSDSSGWWHHHLGD